jgi:hypothetical protein
MKACWHIRRLGAADSGNLNCTALVMQIGRKARSWPGAIVEALGVLKKFAEEIASQCYKLCVKHELVVFIGLRSDDFPQLPLAVMINRWRSCTSYC